MKAARIRDYAVAPVIEELPIPEIGADEVLVRVKAVGLNPLDVLLLGGKRREVFPLPFPYTLGTDLAGTVERAGSLAARWRQGDPILARLDPIRGGALADFAVVPAAQVTAAPSTIPLEDAAGLPTAAGTAWQALFEIAKTRCGQTVLVHAGAGGVGSFAIQLARIAGARVIATASGSGIELAHQLGADQVIDYRNERFWDQLSDIDVVIDTIGGETQQRSFDVLRGGGTLVATASPPDDSLAKAHNVTAVRIFHKSDGSRLGLLSGLIDNGSLRVLIDRKVPRADLGDALAHQSSGRAHGKIIVTLEK
jgi:NADPH:quinone reductase-like Zn-dependent oxidoreductase